MGWFTLKHIFSTIFSFINIRRLSVQEKDLEILVLRQQTVIAMKIPPIAKPISSTHKTMLPSTGVH